MKETYDLGGRGHAVISASNPQPYERYSVRTANLRMSSEDLVEFGKWVTKFGREAIKQEKAEAKELQKQLETKAGIAVAHAIASLNIQPKD